MNSEFIFSSLQAIQDLVNSNRKDLANDYISRFAKLTRGVLQASTETVISLEDDLSILRNYLDLEKFRRNDALSYRINVEDEIDTFDTMVPSMAVQALVEHRIQTDFGRLADTGKIGIAYHISENQLLIEIEDDFGNGSQTIEKAGVGFMSDKLDLLQKHSEVRITGAHVVKGNPPVTQLTVEISLS
jgi:LytS/YehU family sensor histidine kinase